MRIRFVVCAFAVLAVASGCAGSGSPSPAVPPTQTNAQGPPPPAPPPEAGAKKVIYVADYGAGVLSTYGPNGNFIRSIPGLDTPVSVAVDSERNIYVMEQSPGLVNVYHRGARKPFRTVSMPYYAFECLALRDISVGNDGTMYVAYASCEGSSFFGSVMVFAPGATYPTGYLDAYDFANYQGVATDRNDHVFTTLTWYSSSNYGDVVEFDQGSQGYGKDLRLNLINPGGIDVTTNGDIVVCSAAGVQTFNPANSALLSTINVPCGDISLANHNTMIYVTQGKTVTRYHYPSGEVSQTLTGFTDARGVAVQGAISD